MCPQSIFCIASSEFQANHIVDQLKSAHIPDNGISALLADQTASREFSLGRDTKTAEAAFAGAGTGALIGATWGWIAGVGALVIPGAGLFIAAGPIIAAMSGATLGAVFGGICGALIGMGIPEIEAKRFEGKILKGNILLSVHARRPGDIPKAREIFTRAEASDICTVGMGLRQLKAGLNLSEV